MRTLFYVIGSSGAGKDSLILTASQAQNGQVLSWVPLKTPLRGIFRAPKFILPLVEGFKSIIYRLLSCIPSPSPPIPLGFLEVTS